MSQSHQLALPIVLLIFLLSKQGTAQVISGRVLDDRTKDPIPYTNIFFDNSYIGTVCDIDGYFELNISKNPGQNIVVSRVGYQTQLIENYSLEQFLTIYLSQHTYMLDSLVVSASGKSQRKMIKIFLKEFLGESKNARDCVIENMDDIHLEHEDSSGMLVAYFHGPIIITNKRLGYKIRYFLEEFKENKQGMTYRGYAIFEADTTLLKQNTKQIRKRRKKAYLGSRMHFFRTLWLNEPKTSKFNAFYYRSTDKVKFTDHVQAETKDVKILSSPNRIIIMYGNQAASYISFQSPDGVRFTENGYFDPENLLWQGRMSKQRIGDLLPYEYNPANSE